MPKTTRNLLNHALGPDTWLGRALRVPTKFLLRRALAEIGHTTKALHDEMAALAERVSNLEALLLEHPKMHTGNAVLGGKIVAFPSPAVSIILPTWNRAGVIGAHFAVKSSEGRGTVVSCSLPLISASRPKPA